MAWSVLQSASHGTTTAGLTVAVTYGSNTSSGTKLIATIVATQLAANTPISSVKDGAGNSFTQLGTISGSGGGAKQVFLYGLDNPTAGIAPTITATFTGTNADLAILVQEVSGLLAGNTTAMIDGTPGTSQGITTASQAQPAYSSTAANEYLVACFGDNGGPETYTVPTGYTADTHGINNNSTNDIVIAYKNSTGGAESGTWTFTGTLTGAGYVVVAFKLGAAAAAAQPPPPQLVPPGLISPAVLAQPFYPRPSTPPTAIQQPAPAPQLIPPGLLSPMSLGVPTRPATQAPPVPPVITIPSPPPLLTPPGLQSPMVLAEPLYPSQPAPPQQQPAPAPQPIPPGLQSPMSLGVPATPATQAPPQPPEGTPAPQPVPPGLLSPMSLAVPARFSIPPAPQQQPAPAPQLIPPGLLSPMSLGVPTRPATQAPPAPVIIAQPGYHSLTPPGRLSPMSIGLGLYAPSPGPGVPPIVPVVAVVRAALVADYDGKSWWKKKWILRL